MKNLPLLMTGLALIFTACRKEEEEPALDTDLAANEQALAASERAYATEVDAYVFPLSLNSSLCFPGNGNGTVDCVTVTDSGADVYPRTITLDYGDACVGIGGNVRSGVITITWTAAPDQINAQRTVNFVDFAFNDRSITGSRTVTYTGLNAEEQPTYALVIDTDIETANGTLGHNATQNIVWLSGYATAACFDNVFEVTGASTVVRPNGVTVVRTITTPLIVDRVCGYIVAGVIQVTGVLNPRSLDYGDGTCDNIAVLTMNGNTYEIAL